MTTLSTANLNYTINCSIRNGNINYARKLFDQNPASRNVVSWNSIITGCIRHNQMQHAQETFDKMPVRDVVSWNTVLSGLHKIEKPEQVYQCFLQMTRVGERPDEFTFSTVITAFLNTTYNVLIPQLHGLLLCLAPSLCGVFDETFIKDVTTWNALILGYMDLELTGEAQRVFEMMPERNSISWTTLVNGYIKNKNLNEARAIFSSMRERNVISWTAMTKGYVRYGKFVYALELFLLMLNSESGIHLDVVLSTSLVNMYAKCGDIKAAFCIFECMEKKNLVSWNSIIGSYARHGLAKRALEEFDRMMKGGVKPNRITYVNVLSACAHGGLVEEGERHFNSMKTKCGIHAGLEHYACMVDLYGRAGQLKKAEKLIKEMPFEPDAVVWGALIGACGLHSCLEVGEFAAGELCKLEQGHPAVFSMLSKIHGEKGVWSSVIEIRRMMKESHTKKQKAGCVCRPPPIALLALVFHCLTWLMRISREALIPILSSSALVRVSFVGGLSHL
ncbi:hypothetical protein LguiA_021592 [Lonicera macranthoides]